MNALPDLTALLSQTGTKPPVEHWHPEHCGALDLVITRDGRWIHEGSPMGRARMVALFASVLRREDDGSYVLVTPAEKLTITVEDAPFAMVEMRVDGDGENRRIALRDNVGDWIEVGPEHPLRLVSPADAFKPYVLVRGRLEGLLSRALVHDLVDCLDVDGRGLWAGGVYFPVLPA